MDSDDSEIDYSPATLHPDIKVKNDFNGEIPVDFIGKAESNFVGEDRKVVEHAPAGSELIPESEGDTWSEYLEWPLDEKTRPDELKFSDYLDYVPLPHSEQSTKLADLKKMTFICEMCDVNISSKADLKVHCDGFMHRMVK